MAAKFPEDEDCEFSFTESNKRCLKCVFIVINEFPKMLQGILEKSKMPAKSMYAFIQSDQRFKQKLSREEHHALQSLTSNSYSRLDVTLIFKILTNYTNTFIDHPTRGWSATPIDTETTIGDDVLRLKNMRNQCLHKFDACFDEAEFNDFFSKVKGISARIDSYLGLQSDQTFKSRIQTYEHREFKSEERRELLNQYKEQKGIDGYFVLQSGEGKFMVYTTKSFKDFLTEIRTSDSAEPLTGPVTMIFPDINNPEFAKLMDEFKDEINKGLVNVKIKRVKDGSLVIQIALTELLVRNEQLISDAIKEVLQRTCDLFPASNNVLVSMDDSYLPSDELTERPFEQETKEISGRLQLDLEFQRDVFLSNVALRQSITTLLEQIGSKVNGNHSFKSPIISVIDFDKGNNEAPDSIPPSTQVLNNRATNIEPYYDTVLEEPLSKNPSDLDEPLQEENKQNLWTGDKNKMLTTYYLSSQNEKNAIVVRNIPESEPEPTIENCIEVICKDLGIRDIYFPTSSDGRKLKCVALVFLTEKVTDIKSIKQRAKKKTLGRPKQELEFHVLGPPNGIIVYDLQTDTTELQIKYHFDRAKVIGEDNEVTDIKFYSEIQVAVVLFRNPSLAVFKILALPQMLKDVAMIIEPYYEAFHDIIIQAFLKEASINVYEELLERKTDTECHDNLPAKKLMKSLPHRESSETAHDKSVCDKSDDRVFSGFSDFDTEIPIMKPYREHTRLTSDGSKENNSGEKRSRIRILSNDFYDSDSIEADDDRNLFELDVFDENEAWKTESSLSSRSELNNADIMSTNNKSVEQQLPATPSQSERGKVDEIIDKIYLEKTKIILLQIKRFTREYKECNVYLDSKENCVVFVGEKDKIQKAKLKMYEILHQVVTVTKRISKGQKSVLKSHSGKLRNMLKEEHIGAVHYVTHDNMLSCKAFCKKEADKAIEFLLKKVEHKEIPYTQSHFKFLNSPEWTEMTQKIKEEKAVEVAIVRESKMIHVYGFCRECQNAAGKIRRSLNENSVVSNKMIEIKGSKSVCFFHNYKTELEKKRKDIRERKGDLSFRLDGESLVIKVQGDGAVVEDITTSIRHLEQTIWECFIDLRTIGEKVSDASIISRALASWQGNTFLRDFEEKHKCGVHIEKGNCIQTVKSLHVLHSRGKPDFERRHKKPSVHEADHKCVYFGTEIKLKRGNIAHERATVLVHVKAEMGKLTVGRISNEFVEMGGPGFESILSKHVRDCFKSCIMWGAESVALPAVGTGHILKYPVDVVVECLVSEAKEAAKTSEIKKIKFVIHDEDTLEAMKSRLQGSDVPGSVRPEVPIMSAERLKDIQPKQSEEIINQEKISAVSLKLYAASKTKGELLRTLLSKEIRDTFLYEDTCSDSKLKNLPKDTLKRMTSVASKNHVWFEQDESTITPKDEKKAVIKIKNEVLESLSKSQPSSESRSSTNSRNSKCTPGWWIAKSEAKTQVPVYWKHFHKDGGVIDAVLGKGKKFFGISNLEDVNLETFYHIRKLVENTWDQSKVGQGSDAKNLNNKALRIKRIQRIENYELFEKYQTTKKAFYRKLASGRKFQKLQDISNPKSGGKRLATGPVLTADINRSLTVDLDLFSHANEFYFFHGTPKKYADNITVKGLDEKHGGDNGMFGAGIYGAESSTKADQYADEDKTNRQPRNKKMLLMRLLLGNIYVTSKPHRYKLPPCSNCYKESCTVPDHQPFDSVVADGPWLFREFVVYRREQCYPEYLITYDRI